MGLPSITIAFKEMASTAIRRSQKGTIAIILKDSKSNGGHVLYSKDDIPSDIGIANKAYVERAFIGNVNEPVKVILYILPSAATEYTDAFKYFETSKFDYLVGDPAITETLSEAVVTWVKAEREKGHNVKAVLPSITADCEAVVNFTTGGIKAGTTSITTAAYCSRIAGLIVGTPLTQSTTYTQLPELAEVEKLTKSELDSKIDDGEFILFSDSEKIKVGRGVTSLTTVSGNKTEAMKKIKIVETMDMIQTDIIETCEDSYIGKMANSYDNKCILMSAIKEYLEGLETEGILESGKSEVGIDMDAQKQYITSNGGNVNDMTEQEIKEYNTGDKVFLAIYIRMLDAIEDIKINVYM